MDSMSKHSATLRFFSLCYKKKCQKKKKRFGKVFCTSIAFSNSILLTIFAQSSNFALASLSLGARLETTLKSFKASLNLPSAMFAEARR